MSEREMSRRDRWFRHVEIALSLCERKNQIREDILACLTSVFWQAGWDAPATADILAIVCNPGLVPLDQIQPSGVKPS